MKSKCLFIIFLFGAIIFIVHVKIQNYNPFSIGYETIGCGKLPASSDIRHSNTFWQLLNLSQGPFYLYGSYLDTRKGNIKGPSIRILGLRNSSLPPQIDLHCLIWFDEATKPVDSIVSEQGLFWDGYLKNPTGVVLGKLQPYLLNCQLPEQFKNKVPTSVSVVERTCDTVTNNLKVIYNTLEGKKEDFAVCVKTLYNTNDNFRHRFVEWIELISLLGANKIFFYRSELPPNIENVLKLYVEKGLAEVSNYSNPDVPLNQIETENTLNLPQEVIPWNDCLYRNLYRYKYVVVLDQDEVIVPKTNGTWKDLINVLEQESLTSNNEISSSFRFTNVYFMDDMLNSNLKSMKKKEGNLKKGKKEKNDDLRDIIAIPKYMHITRHVFRTKTSLGYDTMHSKSIHNTDRVVSVHSHLAITCLECMCYTHMVGKEIAQLQHYRETCQRPISEKLCNNNYKRFTTKDTTIWRYKKLLLDRVSTSLLKLGFIHPNDVK